MSDMELILGTEHRLVIGQRMYQSMNLLQMSADELTDYLNELSMENPLFEVTPPKIGDAVIHAKARSGVVRGHDGDDYELPLPDKCGCSVRTELTEQLCIMHLGRELERAIRFLIINLDDRGYLSPELEHSGTWQSAPALFASALRTLQGMEPAGIGARSVSECLCIQLDRMGLHDSAAYKICSSYLEHLAKDHINHISKALGISDAETARARKLIASLNPFPSNGYDDGRSDCWIVPDIEVTYSGGELSISILEQRLPRCEVNSYYENMLRRDALSDEEKDYFSEKLSQAQWAINCVKRRYDTLLKCVTALVDEQREFFTERSGALRPCSMSDIAYRVGVHPSTVSRAIKNKYLNCDRGVFPLSKFIAVEVGGETSDEIIRCISEIVANEDSMHPLSDSAICQRLSDLGYDIARRTVAKYRDKALIPSAVGRKRRDGKS